MYRRAVSDRALVRLGYRDRDQEQRNADAVVEPALDIQALADARWNPRVGDDRLAERGVRRSEHDREQHGLDERELPEHGDGREAPATIVNGSPTASSRSGTTYSRRSTARSIRDASEKRTTVSVASATQRTDSLPILGSSHPRTSELATMPPATNTMAGVITDPSSRRDNAAYVRTRSAIAARPEPPSVSLPRNSTWAYKSAERSMSRRRLLGLGST